MFNYRHFDYRLHNLEEYLNYYWDSWWDSNIIGGIIGWTPKLLVGQIPPIFDIGGPYAYVTSYT